MKGIYKGFKYITQIFVGNGKEKEIEIEIGGPTDVKHVSHIGWDGGSGNAAPSWMNEFQTTSDFAETSIDNVKDEKRGGSSTNKNTCSSSSDQLVDGQIPASHKEMTPSGKKHKRKKPKLHSTTSPRLVSSSTRSGPRGTKSKSKSKTKLMEENTKGVDI